MDKEQQSRKFSFTIDFNYSRGVAHCGGPIMETVVSRGIGAKYRVGVKDTENHCKTFPGLSEPQDFDTISKAFDKHGSLSGKVFVFEVFDRESQPLFSTEFDAAERCPADGYASDKMVCTSFSYLFDLPERLHAEAARALDEHFAKIRPAAVTA